MAGELTFKLERARGQDKEGEEEQSNRKQMGAREARYEDDECLNVNDSCKYFVSFFFF